MFIDITNKNIIIHGKNYDDLADYLLETIKDDIDEVFYYNDDQDIFYYIDVKTQFEYTTYNNSPNRILKEIDSTSTSNDKNTLVVFECKQNKIKQNINRIFLNGLYHNVTCMILSQPNTILNNTNLDNVLIKPNMNYFIDAIITINDISNISGIVHDFNEMSNIMSCYHHSRMFKLGLYTCTYYN